MHFDVWLGTRGFHQGLIVLFLEWTVLIFLLKLLYYLFFMQYPVIIVLL